MPPLLERQAALDLLGRATTDARTGDGRVVLVAGEAGIGKTTLVRAHLAALPAGTRTLTGACDDLLTPGPLGPFRDVARETGGPVADAVAAGDVYRLADALLGELASAPATVLVVEDVHWADEATLDVLALLGRRIEHVPAVLVLTYRDDELAPDAPLRRLLGVLRAPVAVRVDVPALSLNAVLQMAGDRAVGLRVHGSTKGNSFLVTEWLASGDGPVLPTSISQSVLGRLARLPAGSRALVEQLAVIPAGAEPGLLDVLRPGWTDDAAPAEELGVLEIGGGQVRFRHELARRAVDESLPGARRLELDQAVVDALLAGPDPEPARVLHHAERCHDVATILDHGPAAARAAAAAGAHRQSLAFYAQVLPHAGGLPVADRAALQEEYAWELYDAHRFADALGAAETAVRLRTGVGEPGPLGRALVTLSRQHYMRAEMPEALAAVERAVELGREQATDPGVVALARAYRGVLLALTDREREALPELAAARELAREGGDAAVVALCDNYSGHARLCLGDGGGLALLERSLADADGLGHQEYRARAYTSIVKGLRRLGRFAEMERYVGDGLAHTRESDFLAHGYTLEAHRHLLAAMRGDLHGAERGLAELESAVPDAGVLGRETLPLRARLLVRLGSPDAGTALGRAADLAARSGILQAQAPTGVAFVEQAWLTGETAAARAHVDLLLERTDRAGAERYRGELLRHLRRLGHDVAPFPGCPDEFAAGLRGDWRAAARAWEEIGDVYERALELAESGEADPTLEALQVLDGIGAVPAARIVRQRLRDLGVTRIPRGPVASTRTNVAGLTDRQTEVLALLGDGLTNAEIAQRLVVSVRTVDHHVSAVLAQLGASSRREAARIAARYARSASAPSDES